MPSVWHFSSLGLHQCLLSTFYTGETRRKMAIYDPGSKFSPDTKSAGSFIWDFSVSGTVKNNCLMFKSHSV
uniref:Uncharacterized protein n=1 Tax=Canis lupus familiaris TaxID=9615 RepID=A0A8C0P617_CANLF